MTKANRHAGERTGERVNLCVVLSQWRMKKRPHLRRSLAALFREMMDMKPDGVRHYEDVADLWLRYSAEADVVLRAPFVDIAKAMGRFPSDREDRETFNRRYVETLIREGDVFVVGSGPQARLFGLRRNYLIHDILLVYTMAWRHHSWKHHPDREIPPLPPLWPIEEWPEAARRTYKAALALDRQAADDYARSLAEATRKAGDGQAGETGKATAPLGAAASPAQAGPTLPGWPQPAGPEVDQGVRVTDKVRKDRRFNEERGVWQLRHLVFPEDGTWPHFAWREDPDQSADPPYEGPWGNCSVGGPDDPDGSPRESMRAHLTKTGRLDLLHLYAPGPDDPPEPE